MSQVLKIIGMDPSLSNFGLASVLLDLDTMEFEIQQLRLLTTEPEKDKKLKKQVRKNSEDLDRAQILHKGMTAACQHHTIAIAEVPVGSQSARAMASYGVCMGILAACPIPLIQVTPNEVKIAATGIRTATKEEMIEWAVAKYPNAGWKRQSHGAPGRMGKGGVIVGAYSKGDPTGDNEHLADAVAAVEAGIQTDQFQQLVAMMRATAPLH